MWQKEQLGDRLLERMTERGRRALSLAEEEARSWNHNYLGTEHLLLGLLREGDGIAGRALENLGAHEERTRAALETFIARGKTPSDGVLAPTPRTKAVFENMVQQAKRLHHAYVGTEHILLALIADAESAAARALALMEVEPEEVAETIRMLIESSRPSVREKLSRRALKALGRTGSEESETKNNVVTCRIADRDLDALDALVEAGVRSTRSDAAAWLIHAGIEANRELLQRVEDTVAEIRRLRNEASLLAKQFVDE